MRNLDEAVHTLCQELVLSELNGADDPDEQERLISEAEAMASRINNAGLEAQLAFLQDPAS